MNREQTEHPYFSWLKFCFDFRLQLGYLTVLTVPLLFLTIYYLLFFFVSFSFTVFNNLIWKERWQLVATISHNQGASLIQVHRDKVSTSPATWHPRKGSYDKDMIHIPTWHMWQLIVKCHSSLIQPPKLAIAALSPCFHLWIKIHQTFIKALIIYRISILVPKPQVPANFSYYCKVI